MPHIENIRPNLKEAFLDEIDILEGRDPKDRKAKDEVFKPWKKHIAGPE